MTDQVIPGERGRAEPAYQAFAHEWATRTYDLVASLFMDAYKVFARYWRNETYWCIPGRLVYCDPSARRITAYIPTFPDVGRVSYYRVEVKVEERPLDDEVYRRDLEEMVRRPVHPPPHVVDSELFVVMGRRRARGFREFIRGRRLAPGRRTACIIHELPETCTKRLAYIIGNFIEHRLRRLIDDQNALLEEPLKWTFKKVSSTWLRFKSDLLEKVWGSLRNAAECLADFLGWLHDRVRWLRERVAERNLFQEAVRAVREAWSALRRLLRYGAGRVEEVLEAARRAVLVEAARRPMYREGLARPVTVDEYCEMLLRAGGGGDAAASPGLRPGVPPTHLLRGV